MAENEQGWKERLAERVRDADRLVVWDYHRDHDTEKAHAVSQFETTDRAEIEDFIACIEIDEAASGRHCMCGGSPHFDIYSGEDLLASLSLHHGVRLRWSEDWPGDAELTRLSSFKVCAWFKDRGINGPWRELQQAVGRSLAYQRRVMAVQEILPEEFSSRFLKTRDDKKLVELFSNSTENSVILASWCFRILGCDHASWELMDEVTHANAVATKIMPILGKRACSDALRNAVSTGPDRDACYGAARFLYYFGGWRLLDEQAVHEALPIVTRVTLTHPRQRIRQHIMWTLSHLQGGGEPLRQILEGESMPAAVKPHEATEPSGSVFTRGRAPDEPLDVSDKAYAAWLLGSMGMVEARETIQKLAREAEGADKKALERALEALGNG